jgi:hypothetical protein
MAVRQAISFQEGAIMSAHTVRTLKYYREQGYHCDMVERFIPFPAPGHRKDFHGFGDILAYNNCQTIMIQSCGQSFAVHLRDLLKNPQVPLWISGPRMLFLVGWRKLLKRKGGKQKIWVPRIREINYLDFQ